VLATKKPLTVPPPLKPLCEKLNVVGVTGAGVAKNAVKTPLNRNSLITRAPPLDGAMFYDIVTSIQTVKSFV